ncbi:MAG TPA: 3-hydroxyacyl-CoA dehydrogenase NAD-binding domain-containing protein [Planctomycetota bacterium]|nr:3-hydroxyacyl-CoA dehydrogenase NAD-binding domain-containing protein [Planctomycetota bacterium]
MKTSTIAVFGTGTIGSSWAALFAAHGFTVRLFDTHADAIAAGMEKARTMLETMCEPDEVSEAAQRLKPAATASAALQGVSFVQESVLERYTIKQEAHELIERYAPQSAIVASSSSGLLANKMQLVFRHPERFLVAHPFNPPHLIPLVELVAGPRTSETCLRAAFDLYTSMKRVPVILKKEIPGHLANRIAAAVWREAIDLVASGAATLEDVDKALYAGPGMRWAFMGQHLIYHLNGGRGGYAQFFEHFGPALESYLADMATWTTVPDAARKEVLAQMAKAVEGKSIPQLEAWRDERLKALARLFYSEEPVLSRS